MTHSISQNLSTNYASLDVHAVFGNLPDNRNLRSMMYNKSSSHISNIFTKILPRDRHLASVCRNTELGKIATCSNKVFQICDCNGRVNNIYNQYFFKNVMSFQSIVVIGSSQFFIFLSCNFHEFLRKQ